MFKYLPFLVFVNCWSHIMRFLYGVFLYYSKLTSVMVLLIIKTLLIVLGSTFVY